MWIVNAHWTYFFSVVFVFFFKKNAKSNFFICTNSHELPTYNPTAELRTRVRSSYLICCKNAKKFSYQGRQMKGWSICFSNHCWNLEMYVFMLHPVMSHWPCIRFGDIPTYGLNGLRKSFIGVWHLYLCPVCLPGVWWTTVSIALCMFARMVDCSVRHVNRSTVWSAVIVPMVECHTRPLVTSCLAMRVVELLWLSTKSTADIGYEQCSY